MSIKIEPGKSYEATLTERPKDLRDEFTMAALSGLLAHIGLDGTPPTDIADIVDEIAGAMMEAREK